MSMSLEQAMISVEQDKILIQKIDFLNFEIIKCDSLINGHMESIKALMEARGKMENQLLDAYQKYAVLHK